MKPLKGVRVLEFAVEGAGPWAARHMADFGAEVVKIESKAHPDSYRFYVKPYQPEIGVQPQLSSAFTERQAGKRFGGLNVMCPEGIDLFMRLVAISDILVENNSTGVMGKLGLDYDTVRSVKPDIIIYSSTGFGDTGPYSRYVSFGPNLENYTGFRRISGFAHRYGAFSGTAHIDWITALHGLFAIMCALEYRRKTGKGQHIRLSQAEVGVSSIGHVVMEYLANGRERQYEGNTLPYAAPHGCYRCRGVDRWCTIAVFDDEEWRRLCTVIGRQELTEDPRFATLPERQQHVEELDRVIEEWTASRDPHEVMHVMQDAGIAAGVVQDGSDLLLRDAQLAARAFHEVAEHVKKGTTVAGKAPLGLTATPGHIGLAGQPLGYDNDYIFGDLLGLTRDEISDLVEKGIIEAA